MSTRFKVVYNVKHTDKSHDKYGVLLQRTTRFHSFTDAVNFVRLIGNKMDKDVTVVGKPILERI
jgi:hypothetical protein